MPTDEKGGVKILVCIVGSTVLHFDLRCIDDLNVMLKRAGGLGQISVKRRTSHVAEKGRTSHYGHRF